MDWMCDHLAEARQMGLRAREAVLEKYNWDAQAAKLVGIYSRLTES